MATGTDEGLPAPPRDAGVRDDLTRPGARSGRGAASVLPYLSDSLRARPVPPDGTAGPESPPQGPESPHA